MEAERNDGRERRALDIVVQNYDSQSFYCSRTDGQCTERRCRLLTLSSCSLEQSSRYNEEDRADLECSREAFECLNGREHSKTIRVL